MIQMKEQCSIVGKAVGSGVRDNWCVIYYICDCGSLT